VDDRAPEDDSGGTPLPERRYTFLLVPEGGGGRVQQLTLTLAQARLLLLTLLVLVGVALLGVAVFVTALPRTLAYGELVDENLAIKSQLRDVDGKLDQVEDELRRLRLIDSQLRGLPGGVLDGWGPVELPLGDPQLPEGLHVEPDVGSTDVFDMDVAGDGIYGDPMEEPPGETIAPADLSRAQAWAMAVADRVDRVLEMVAVARPRVEILAERALGSSGAAANIPLGLPTQGVFTSGFGYRRSPFNRAWKFHGGVDISAPTGTPIVAPGAGTVVTADWSSGYGRLVEIDHGNGVLTRFAHNSRMEVTVGERVVRGQVISRVGSSGQVTGPHLHYEILVRGQKVDPMEFIRR
jgi:Peptidase family M23